MKNKSEIECLEVAPTLDMRSGRSGENSFATSGGLVAEHRTPNIERRTSNAIAEDVMTLAIRGRGADCNLEIRKDGTANAILTPNGGRGGIGCGAVAIPIHDSATRHAGMDGTGGSTGKAHGLGIGGAEDPMFTLTKGDKHSVAIGVDGPEHALKAEGFDASEDGAGRGVPLVAEVANPVTGNPYADPEGRESKLVPEICGALSDGAHMGGGLNGQDAYTGRIFAVRQQQMGEGKRGAGGGRVPEPGGGERGFL